MYAPRVAKPKTKSAEPQCAMLRHNGLAVCAVNQAAMSCFVVLRGILAGVLLGYGLVPFNRWRPRDA
jgi:hypothetical protein